MNSIFGGFGVGYFASRRLGNCGERSGHMCGRALLRDVIAIGVVLCSMAPLSAAAQEWPSRPMTIVVPFAAGGAGDGTARVLAVGLSQVLGQNVIVENISGAGGTIGAN